MDGNYGYMHIGGGNDIPKRLNRRSTHLAAGIGAPLHSGDTLNLGTDGVSMLTYVMVAAGLGIIYLFPYVTKAIPSPLVTIVVLTALAMILKLDVRVVGDMGELPDTLPIFLFPDVPLTLETLKIIFPVSAAIAVVGLLESLMTASLIDDLTDTKSDKNQECIGQGIANTATGFIGGMAGCAMIGQSMINVKSGGRGRLSCFAAGVFLLFLIVVLGDWVKQIPMPALVAIMIMVSIGTFSWKSIKDLTEHPRPSSIVMLATVVVTVYTHNLALGVLTGVLLSGLFFAWKIAQVFRVTSTLSDDGTHRTYLIEGQLFYASTPEFAESFDYDERPTKVTIDVHNAHIWDISSVSVLDLAVLKFRRDGAEVELIGMNEASETLMGRLSERDDPAALERLLGH
jgi:SulP family sulfate permease